MLMELAIHSTNMRFVLLSATPIFNSYAEIIWLVNLLNVNDKRPAISIKDVFDSRGEFVRASSLNELAESGDDLLRRKLVGYISFVRGENPYIFPYRIYPVDFAREEHRLIDRNYPKYQMTGAPLLKEQRIRFVQVYLTHLPKDTHQAKFYRKIMDKLVPAVNATKMGLIKAAVATSLHDQDEVETQEEAVSEAVGQVETQEEALREAVGQDKVELQAVGQDEALREAVNPPKKQRKPRKQKAGYPEDEFAGGAPQLSTDVFGFKVLRPAMQALNIVFPGDKTNVSDMIGQTGLTNCIKWKETKTDTGVPIIQNFEYLSGIKPFLGKQSLHEYSIKMHSIMETIENSQGIIMIYTKYVFSGAVPLALALEERGFDRYCSNSGFKNLMSNNKPSASRPKYAMITGNKLISPTNAEDVNFLTKSDNKNGELVKVVIITDAGSEGLDFKNIRQIHILDPWYNLNRIEQIIGRGVRNYSHCGLDFEDRNVEIYMHAVLDTASNKETADLYMYRLAENKAIRAGKITRIMKESAVDCLLNQSQRNFTEKVIQDSQYRGKIPQRISSLPDGETIQYSVGDREESYMCDYMPCEYKCVPSDVLVEEPSVPTQYTTDFLTQKQNNIMRRVRDAFREKSAYHRNELFRYVNAQHNYTIQQFLFALTAFVQNPGEVLVNASGHKGYLVNRGDYYAFQPAEISDESLSQFERDIPIPVRPIKLRVELQDEISKQNFDLFDPVAIKTAAATATAATATAKTAAPTTSSEGARIFADLVQKCKSSDLPKTNKSSWYSFVQFCTKEDNAEQLYLDDVDARHKTICMTQHYVENDISLQNRVSLYSYIYPLMGPVEEGATRYAFEYLRKSLSDKIMKEGGNQYLFLWNGKYPEGKEDRKKMYQTLSNRLLVDAQAKHVYVWHPASSSWRLVNTDEDPSSLVDLTKIQSRLFNRAAVVKPAKVFGFAKQGFAIYVDKGGELNQNKGALCSNKTKRGAIKSYLEEVLHTVRPDIQETQLDVLDKWMKDENNLQPVACVASELQLQWRDKCEHGPKCAAKDKKRHYLDTEEYFLYQWSTGIK
jgi:hypothetical protein